MYGGKETGEQTGLLLSFIQFQIVLEKLLIQSRLPAKGVVGPRACHPREHVGLVQASGQAMQLIKRNTEN